MELLFCVCCAPAFFVCFFLFFFFASMCFRSFRSVAFSSSCFLSILVICICSFFLYTTYIQLDPLLFFLADCFNALDQDISSPVKGGKTCVFFNLLI